LCSRTLSEHFLNVVSLDGSRYLIAAGEFYAGFAIFLFVWHMNVRNGMAHAGSEVFPAGWVDTSWLDWISTTMHR